MGFSLHARYRSLSDNLLAAIIITTLVAISAGAMLLLNRLWRPAIVRRTGYELSFSDFRRLVSDPYCTPVIAPLLKEWFQYEIQGREIRAASGHKVDLHALHAGIQADQQKQYTIYQRAMDLWR